MLQKEQARNEKTRDKESSNHEYTMDLESVLFSPRLQASALCYKTKLAVHNFTIFDLHSLSGTCFVWHEAQGGLTSDEFASCICQFVDMITVELQVGEKIIFWSLEHLSKSKYHIRKCIAFQSNVTGHND